MKQQQINIGSGKDNLSTRVSESKHNRRNPYEQQNTFEHVLRQKEETQM
jgi:hypothetical protein